MLPYSTFVRVDDFLLALSCLADRPLAKIILLLQSQDPKKKHTNFDS